MSREPPLQHSSSSSVHSIAGNYICHSGNMEGLKELIAAIEKMPNLTSLKCASIVECAPVCRATLGARSFYSHP